MLRLVETNQADGTVTLHYRDNAGHRCVLSLTPDFQADVIRIHCSGADPVPKKEAANIVLLELPIVEPRFCYDRT